MNIKYLKIELIPGRSVTFAKPPTAKSIPGLFRKYNCTKDELDMFCSVLNSRLKDKKAKPLWINSVHGLTKTC